MGKKRDIRNVNNPVLREIIAEIQQEKEQKCSFPFWNNWNNWINWINWNNWNNWDNWRNWINWRNIPW